ncbi:IclR family transcriptional regulator [Oceanospirillum linum]|nr:IclR family transcriptional regulator [Oceanospirillum linum]SEF40344.1 DNA-binding transcriptional regulator, IclR family [Oleiphilus messinensis]SMP00450.1 transcriptional regulator, IclR family [Oceanospirillum linum]
MSTSENNYIVPALQKGLQILELFDSHHRLLSQTEMAEALGVSNSSIYRIVQTLIAMGYLNKAGGGNYSLGSQVVSRGFSYLASREIVEIAAPFITQLRDSTSLSSHLAIREGSETLYLFRALALQRVSVNVMVGTRFPCHITAMGRALLQGLAPDQLESLYQGQRIDGYPEPAPQTLPDLIAMCEKERAQGWSMHYSDYSTAIAVPIRNFTGEVVAAINASGPDVVMQKEGVTERLVHALKKTADGIMKELGGITTRR